MLEDKAPPLQSVRVMIVDDDEAAATDLAQILQAEGASCERFAGADLERALSAHVDAARRTGAAVVAVIAAESDGEGLVRADRLRERAALSPLRVCVASAQISRESLSRHARTVGGADAYLRKPYDEARARACFVRLREGAPGTDERLWWLDDRSEPLPEPSRASGSGSGSPIGIPGLDR